MHFLSLVTLPAKPSRLMKQLAALLLVIALSFSTPGCALLPDSNGSAGSHTTTTQSTVSAADNSEFEDFASQLFAKTVDSDTVSLHSYLEHPANYGIDDYTVSLGRYDLNNLDNTSDIVACINQLQSFDRSTLSERQQITYDELVQYMNTELEYSDLYMFNSSLSTTIGIQVQLPIILAEYSFEEEKDVQEYLALLNDVDGYFQNMIDYETLRSQKGYFMEDTLADKIITQCQTFVDSASDGYLLSTFDEKLNGVSGISDAQKALYKSQNSAAVTDHVIPGYQLLITGLKHLKGTNKHAGGLKSYPNGTKYFEYLLQHDLGWTKSVDDYNALLDTYIKKNILTMQVLTGKDQTLADKFSSFSFSITDPQGILNDLKSKISADFPDGPVVDCDIKYVTKALQDYASPAMYFTPQIDNLSQNSIYINSGSNGSSDLYTTLAHEGYPGHMYQLTYFSNSNPDLIRYAIEPGGYIEGWATYCELYSYSYADTGNAALNTLAQANYATILCLYAKADIGVNYYGWSVDDLYSYIKDYGFDSRETASSMYYSMVSEPGNYCKYVLGYIAFNELKNTARSALSDKFNLKDFHKFILDMGPVQFDILNTRLQDWISARQ